jgi:starch synthase
MKEPSPLALEATVQRALLIYKQPKIWRQLQDNAMSGDFSWQASAEQYITLYQQVLKTPQIIG